MVELQIYNCTTCFRSSPSIMILLLDESHCNFSLNLLWLRPSICKGHQCSRVELFYSDIQLFHYSVQQFFSKKWNRNGIQPWLEISISHWNWIIVNWRAIELLQSHWGFLSQMLSLVLLWSDFEIIRIRTELAVEGKKGYIWIQWLCLRHNVCSCEVLFGMQ